MSTSRQAGATTTCYHRAMPSRRRSSDPPALEIRRFAPLEAAEAIRRLTVRIADVQALDGQKTRYDDERVHATARKIRSTILEIFGERSPEYREHHRHIISATGHPAVVTSRDDEHAVEQDFVQRGIPRTITMLQALIETVGERIDWARPGPEQTDPAATPTASDDVFIVHGRNEGAREAVARVIEKLRLKPIILDEQASEGRTLIEKLEDHAEVGFAVVLLTGDDRGGRIDAEPATYQPRARQNVVLELGYFLGKLKRRRVCVLYEEGVEMPSDYKGVAYVPRDPGGVWRLRLAKEIKAVGLPVDIKDLWVFGDSCGSFSANFIILARLRLRPTRDVDGSR